MQDSGAFWFIKQDVLPVNRIISHFYKEDPTNVDVFAANNKTALIVIIV